MIYSWFIPTETLLAAIDHKKYIYMLDDRASDRSAVTVTQKEGCSVTNFTAFCIKPWVRHPIVCDKQQLSRRDARQTMTRLVRLLSCLTRRFQYCR